MSVLSAQRPTGCAHAHASNAFDGILRVPASVSKLPGFVPLSSAHNQGRDSPLTAMVRMVEGRPAGGAANIDPRTAGSRTEPYPGHSKGLPYEPTTERDLYWRPEVAQEPASQVPASSEYDCGIGINLVFDQGLKTLVVDGVVPGGPAARSGLVHAGDIVAEVDGINVAGQPLDIVDSLLRGVSVAPHPSELHSPPRRACCLAALCSSVHGLTTSCARACERPFSVTGIGDTDGVDAGGRSGRDVRQRRPRRGARNSYHAGARTGVLRPRHYQAKADRGWHHL